MKDNVKINFVYNSIYQLANIVIPIVTMPYLSRSLGPNGMGDYSFAYSIAFYFALFVKLGLQNYGNRTIAEIRDDIGLLSETFWEIYFFQFIMGGIITLAYFIYAFCFSFNSLTVVMSLIILGSTFDITWFLYGVEEFKVASIRDIFVKIAIMIGILLFVKEGRDVTKYAAVYSIGMLISQLISWPFLGRRIHFVRPKKENIKKHIKPNIMLFIPVIAVSLYTMMDKIMLGALSTNMEVGYYHCSENAVQIPLALITALGTVMLPRITNMIANDSDNVTVQETFDMSLVFAEFIATSMGIGMMTIAPEFVPLFYGKGFDKCVQLFYIILPSCIFVAFANVIRTQYLIPRKRDDLYIKSILTGAVINIFSNYILIPRYASIGAAIGTLLAEIIVCVVQAASVFCDAHIGSNILRITPFLVAGISMFILFNGYKPDIGNEWVGIVIKIVCAGGAYLLILMLIILPIYAYKYRNKSNHLEI